MDDHCDPEITATTNKITAKQCLRFIAGNVETLRNARDFILHGNIRDCINHDQDGPANKEKTLLEVELYGRGGEDAGAGADPDGEDTGADDDTDDDTDDDANNDADDDSDDDVDKEPLTVFDKILDFISLNMPLQWLSETKLRELLNLLEQLMDFERSRDHHTSYPNIRKISVIHGDIVAFIEDIGANQRFSHKVIDKMFDQTIVLGKSVHEFLMKKYVAPDLIDKLVKQFKAPKHDLVTIYRINSFLSNFVWLESLCSMYS